VKVSLLELGDSILETLHSILESLQQVACTP
jgi:hypothetical protein